MSEGQWARSKRQRRRFIAPGACSIDEEVSAWSLGFSAAGIIIFSILMTPRGWPSMPSGAYPLPKRRSDALLDSARHECCSAYFFCNRSRPAHLQRRRSPVRRPSLATSLHADRAGDIRDLTYVKQKA